MRQVSYPVGGVLVLNRRMNKHPMQQPNFAALVPLLVRVKTAPSVHQQLNLLCEGGKFRSLKIHALSEKEKVVICSCCGAATTPWGSYGDLLDLEFIVNGFRLQFRSREIWEGGRAALRRLLKNPQSYSSNIEKKIERLRIKRLPRTIESLFFEFEDLPGSPQLSQISGDPFVETTCPVHWIPITISYSGRELDVRQNSLGFNLSLPVEGLRQCAADVTYYPLGSILCIKTNDVEQFWVVTESADVIGARHVHLHFNSLTEQEACGLLMAKLIVIRLGWN
jgi:3D (Asp-Asp-Asp) domain-containing protein